MYHLPGDGDARDVVRERAAARGPRHASRPCRRCHYRQGGCGRRAGREPRIARASPHPAKITTHMNMTSQSVRKLLHNCRSNENYWSHAAISLVRLNCEVICPSIRPTTAPPERRLWAPSGPRAASRACVPPSRESCIDNLRVRNHRIIEMILGERPCAMGV